MGMKRAESFRDVNAVVQHIPTYLEGRVAQESFIHEAVQYALWLPFAAAARYAGWNGTAYLFFTWFILGELMLVYLHQKIVKLRWWQVLAFVGAAAAYFSAELALDANSYWKFLVWYVIVGITALALCLPMVPRRFLAGVPEFLLEFALVGAGGKNTTTTTTSGSGSGNGSGSGGKKKQ